MRICGSFLGGVALLCAMAGAAHGVTFTGSLGNLEAEAEFTVSGTNLIVRLTNTSVNDCLVPADLLTAVFFDISGSPVFLTPVSALLTGGSVVHNGPNGGGNVGGEWDYADGVSGAPGGGAYGIGSAGLGIFGNGNFNGPDLEPPTAVNGLNYGILSTGDNPATGNSPLQNNPLIQDEVTFTLSGLPAGFDITRINNVWFQYGTDLSEPNFPTPGTLGLLGLAGLVVARRRR
jgi:MYXO-CTERM domain-containing protein